VSAAADVAAATPRTEAPASTGLRVFLACGEWVLAFPADAVARLLSVDEAPALLPPSGSPSPGREPHLGRLVVEGKVHSAWDLGSLLGLRGPAEAWLLLRSRVGGRDVDLALRTGPCLSVGPLPPRSERLPLSLSRERTGLFGQAFVAEGIARGRAGLSFVGLVVEPHRLFGEDSVAAIDQDQAEGSLAE